MHDIISQVDAFGLAALDTCVICVALLRVCGHGWLLCTVHGLMSLVAGLVPYLTRLLHPSDVWQDVLGAGIT